MRPFTAGADHPGVRRFLEIKDNRKGNPERLITLEGLFELGLPGKAKLPLSSWIACEHLLRSDEARSKYEELCASDLPGLLVSEKVFLRLVDREDPDGLAALAALPIASWPPAEAPRRLLVLDGIEIPGNAGTMLRSADGAGWTDVVFLRRKMRLTHPKMVHASLGACFHLRIYDLETPEELLRSVSAWKSRVYLADSKGKHPQLASKADDASRVLVLGGEKQGIHTDWYDVPHEKLTIPMRGSVDSLNVACAATVLLYALAPEA